MIRPTSARQTRAWSTPALVSIATRIGLAVGPDGRLDRQQVGVVVEVRFLLPAVGVERLAEVALGIKQADADQRDAQVAGALEVVAGQDAEAARVDRQALVEAELGREVGDRAGPEAAGVDRGPGPRVLEVFREAAEGVIDPRVEHDVGDPLEGVGRLEIRVEELDRVVVGLAPEVVGSSSRKRLMTLGCQVHQRFRASSLNFSTTFA